MFGVLRLEEYVRRSRPVLFASDNVDDETPALSYWAKIWAAWREVDGPQDANKGRDQTLHDWLMIPPTVLVSKLGTRGELSIVLGQQGSFEHRS